MAYKLFIFDLDGTLIDSGAGVKKALEVFEDRLCLEHFPQEEADFIVGPPIVDSIHRTHPELAVEKLEEYGRLFDECYSEVLLYGTYAYEGIAELLDMIISKGGIAAIDTAKRQNLAEGVLNECGLLDKFDHIEFWSEEKNNKPLLMKDVIEHYDIPKDKIVTIGDSRFDGEAANANGIDLVAVRYGYGFGKIDDEKAYKPKYIVNSVKELKEFIMNNI